MTVSKTRYIDKVFLLLFILFIAVTTSTIPSSAADISTVNTNFVNINSLSAGQKKKIVYSKPNVKIQHPEEEITLVYRPTARLKEENHSNLKSADTKATAQTKSSSSSSNMHSYPNTGDHKNRVYLLVGLFLSGSTLFLLIIKRKNLKQIMLFLLLLGNVCLLETYTVNAEVSKQKLLPSKSESLTIGSSFSDQVVPINGFDYIGYIHAYKENSIPSSNKKGIVEIMYIDENQNELIPSIKISGNIGDSYQTEIKELPGYRLTNTPINSTGKFTEEKQTVTYIYKAIQNTSEVIVNYLDESGTELINPITIKGTIGENYQTKAEEISGYKLITTPENASGKFILEKQTVNYIYEKENVDATITIKFVDSNGAPFVLPDLTTEDHGSYNPFYPNLEKYYMKLDYNDTRYDQGKPVNDIILPTKIGENYSLPAKMRFNIYDDKNVLVDHIASPSEGGSLVGICYWENYEGSPKNINGEIKTKNVIVTYKILAYGYAVVEA